MSAALIVRDSPGPTPLRARRATPADWAPRSGLLAIFALVLLGLPTGAAERADRELRTTFESVGYGTVELKSTSQAHLLVTARLNGNKLQCAIDTGFTYSAVNRKRAAKLPPLDVQDRDLDIPSIQIRLSRHPWVRIGHLEIGGMRFENIPAQSVTWREGPRRDWLTRLVDGEELFDSDIVLGADFLRRQHAVIVYGNPALLLVRPTRSNADEATELKNRLEQSGYLSIPLYQLESLGWVVASKIDGARVPLLLDTGGAVTMVDYGLVKQLGSPTFGSTLHVQGVEGKRASLGAAQFNRVELGSLSLERVKFGVADLSRWHLSRTNSTLFQPRGILGSDFLSRTRAVIDCDNRLLWCRPPATSPAKE